MAISVEALSKMSTRCPRIFSLRPIETLAPNLDLRVTLPAAAEKLGLNPNRPEQYVKALSELGIYEYGGTRCSLNRITLSRALEKSVPQFLKLRFSDKKTNETRLRAVIGRIGNDAIFQPFDVYQVVRRDELSLQEKALIAIAHYRQFDFEDTSFLADLTVPLLHKAYPSDRENREALLVEIARGLLSNNLDEKIKFMIAVNAHI